MPTLHLLGTGAALSSADRTTTMLAVEAETVIVVDCGGDVLQRLLAAGLDPDRIALLVITHGHPDHVSGFPLFMEKIWLAQRRRPIPVCGPSEALDAARRLFEVFDTSGWRGLPEIEWREVAREEGERVWEDDVWRVTATPVEHGVPTMGILVEHRGSSRRVAYSGDTAPSPALVRLAAGADLLVHEATGDFKGHTSAEGAAEIAAEAGVGGLVLVHLPPEIPTEELARARARFAALEIGVDGASHPF
jgi:ribonuclease Z